MEKQKQIKKVYIIYKKSVYQKYILDEKNKNLKNLIKTKHPSTKNLLKTHKTHIKAIKQVQELLKKHGIQYKISVRSAMESFKNYDMIVTIGGDGTVLRAAQYVKNQLILGINSVPDVSVGALCSIKINEIEEKIAQIAQGKIKVKNLSRIKLQINNKALSFEPINDILFTNISPAGTSRYLIAVNQKKEEHKSSGLWVSTPSGSTAAIFAAGGQKQKPTDKRIQYLVREPYEGIYNPYSLTKGFIAKGKKLTITSKMIQSKIYLDGPTTHFPIYYGDKITFSLSKNILKMVI